MKSSMRNYVVSTFEDIGERQTVAWFVSAGREVAYERLWDDSKWKILEKMKPEKGTFEA